MSSHVWIVVAGLVAVIVVVGLGDLVQRVRGARHQQDAPAVRPAAAAVRVPVPDERQHAAV